MKKTTLILFISGIFLVASFVQTGCTHQSGNLTSYQDNFSNLVAQQNTDMWTTDYDVVFYNSLENPAAGPGSGNNEIPPAIEYLLLSGKGSIGGFVWDDLNGNGVFDIGEPGLQGVTVFIDMDENGTYSLWEPSGQTDASGNFDISRIKQGSYRVYNDTSTIPDQYNFTTSHPLLINLARKQDYNEADFGLQEMSAIIAGTLWNDSNSDGIIDPGENAIIGSRVYLDQNGNGIFDFSEPSSISNSEGLYNFSSLPRGAYLVTLDGNMFNPSFIPTSGTTLPTPVTLIAGESIDNVNFGFVLWTGMITGFLLDVDTAEGWGYATVFIDLNGNGLYDEGEPTATTDENGMFTFSGLAPGTYTILVKVGELPGDYNLPIPSYTITLDEGETAYANFLTVAEPVTVQSYIWDDANANEIRDAGEDGLENVRVFSDANSNGELDPDEISTFSGPDGSYSLSDLNAGPLRIRVDESTLPGDYLLTTNNIPVYQITYPGNIFTEASFGYQERLAIMHTNDYPSRIALRTGGGMYVSDPQKGSVFIYDSGLNITGELKGLQKPLGVATDASDSIYIGSGIYNNVAVYDSAGLPLITIGDGLLATPNDLTFDRDGKLYVVDSHSAKVWIFNPDGSLSGSFGSLGSGPGQFMFPKAIAIAYRTVGVDEIGEIYVGDQARQLVLVFDMLGNFLRSFGGPVQSGMSSITWQGLFSALQSMDFDQYGRLHTLDSNLDIVQILDPITGGYIDYYNAHLPENLGKLNLQLDIAINSSSEVLMTNVATKAIEEIYTIPVP